MFSIPYRRLLWIVVVLVLASLACRFMERGSQPTQFPLPAVTQALQNPQATIQAPGEISLSIDETELTSILVSELQNQQDPLLQNPKVLLRDGQLKITGQVQEKGLTADLEMALTISASQEGRLAYQLVSAQLGPFPLPQELKDTISQQLDAVLSSDINPRFENVFIESVTIANGQMVIEGHPR